MAMEKVKEINLGWQNNFFEFEFVALNYTNAKNNMHAYKLEGFESDWNYIKSRRYGRYTNIPGGTYVFRLKGSNNDGIWNENGASIKLSVKFPPWQRWWAYCIYTGIIFIIGLIIFVYIKKLRAEVADRKQAQKALQKSEEKYRDLIENSPDLRYRTDREGKIIFISQSVLRLSGYTVEEAIGMNLEKIYSNAEKRDQFLFKLKDKGVVENFETLLNRKDGSTWWASTNAQFYKDEDDNILGVEGVTRDVTELKLAQEKKEKLESRLKQVQKMESIGTLAGGIAHDFNNILTGIFGFSQLIKSDISDSEKVIKHVDNISKGAGKAADLVQQILTFSRKSKQEKHPLNISLVIKEALKLLRSSIPATIEIREKISSSGNVLADPSKIHQVIMNLCTNAYHAMLENGGTLTVGLQDVKILKSKKNNDIKMLPGKYLELTVSDTGQGMAPEILSKIFEPYFTTKELDKGTGLGLAVVLGIVEEHKGYLNVESQVNMGSRFQIFFPATDKKAGLDIPQEEKKIDVRGTERILMIDDEQAILTVVKVFLEQYGYKVITFTDGIQGFEEFKKGPDKFDLVITDMTMPRITGDKLSSMILDIRPGIPIILCTGYSHIITKEKALEIGIRNYIEKPIVLKDLLISVRNVLDVS